MSDDEIALKIHPVAVILSTDCYSINRKFGDYSHFSVRQNEILIAAFGRSKPVQCEVVSQRAVLRTIVSPPTDGRDLVNVLKVSDPMTCHDFRAPS